MINNKTVGRYMQLKKVCAFYSSVTLTDTNCLSKQLNDLEVLDKATFDTDIVSNKGYLNDFLSTLLSLR